MYLHMHMYILHTVEWEIFTVQNFHSFVIYCIMWVFENFYFEVKSNREN